MPASASSSRADPPSVPRSPAAPIRRVPATIDITAIQAALTPYRRVARVTAALLRCCGLPGDTTLTVHLRGDGTGAWVERVQIERPPITLDDPCWTNALRMALLATVSGVDAELDDLSRRVATWIVRDRTNWNAKVVITVTDGLPNPNYRVHEPEPAPEEL